MILVGDWAPGIKQVRLTNSTTTIVLGNMEGPILPCEHSLRKLPKAGPSLFSCQLPLGNNQFIFSLANNHIMDYGLFGLDETIKSINKNGFKACGAGNNIDDARRPIIIKDEGIQVGIIACCEAQFGVARPNSPGVAEFGPWVHHTIRDLRHTVDAVVVSCHAAIEDSPWPSPYIRDLYRSFIDAGATVVHGHHSHIPQGYEAYDDGVIFYGMGNFAVDPDQWRSYPNATWSLAAKIDFSFKPVHWQQLTFEIRDQPDSEEIVIKESTAAEQEIHDLYLTICNRPFANPDLLEALWQEVALRAYFNYGAKYMGISASPNSGFLAQAKVCLSTFKSVFFNIIASFRHRQNDYLLRYHLFACESHRQMLTTALGVLSGEINDQRTEETRRLVDGMMPWSVGVL